MAGGSGGWPGQAFQAQALPLVEIPLDPGFSPNVGFVYGKDATSRTELHYIDDLGAITQITKAGKLNPTALTEDIALTDLTDVTAKTGTGTVVVMQGNPTLNGLTLSGNITGQLLSEDASAAAPTYSFTSTPGTGVYITGLNGRLGFTVGGTARAGVFPSGLIVASDGGLNWMSTVGITGTADLVLARDGPGQMAVRDGGNSQTLRIYNTFTDASNYERLNIRFLTGNALIQTDAAGTGVTTRSISIQTSGAGTLNFGTDATTRWQIGASTGHLLAFLDNTYDIGASGATRPRSIHWGTQALAPNGTAAAPSFAFATDVDAGIYSISNNRIGISTNGILRWEIENAGLMAGTDNSIDIGAIGGSRPRSIFVGTAVQVGFLPATVGAVRLANNSGIFARNAANTADIPGIAVNAADRVAIGGSAVAVLVDNSTGSLGFFSSIPVTIRTSGANLTNNVTAGGTDDTIANFTDLVVYANDAATIRNDIYQLARKLKQINDGLRSYGLFT